MAGQRKLKPVADDENFSITLKRSAMDMELLTDRSRTWDSRCLKWLMVLLTCSLLSCSSVLKSSKITALRSTYCAPTMQYEADTAFQRSHLQDTLVAGKLTAHDYTLAAHMGLLPLLSQYLSSIRVEEKLLIKQKMTDRVLLFQTEVDAVAAELDCDGERFEQLARFLDARNSQRNTQLTVASIVIGAAITVSTAFIKNDDVNKGINIGGGLAGAGLGFLLLNPRGKKVALPMNRSLLKNVWTEQNADLAFPPALWRVMTEKSFSNNGQMTLVQTLKKRWALFTFDGQVNKDDELLYFGKGGYFSEETLQHLSDMTNELQASVRTVQQDLRSLISSTNRWP